METFLVQVGPFSHLFYFIIKSIRVIGFHFFLFYSLKLKLPYVGRHGSTYEFNPSYWRYHDSGGFKDLKLPILW